jgi:hypothetical protein
MSAYPCLCVDRPPAAFVRALKSGITGLKSLPGAACLIRNGGAELALKSALLHPFEQHLECSAITERRFVDLTLACRRCEGIWARVEFKHNFCSQLGEVDGWRHDAREKLLRSEVAATHLFYVHFIASLFAESGSIVRRMHDALASRYKHFSGNGRTQLEQAASTLIRQRRAASTGRISDPWDPAAHSSLDCWAEWRDDAKSTWAPL